MILSLFVIVIIVVWWHGLWSWWSVGMVSFSWYCFHGIHVSYSCILLDWIVLIILTSCIWLSSHPHFPMFVSSWLSFSLPLSSSSSQSIFSIAVVSLNRLSISIDDCLIFSSSLALSSHPHGLWSSSLSLSCSSSCLISSSSFSLSLSRVGFEVGKTLGAWWHDDFWWVCKSPYLNLLKSTSLRMKFSVIEWLAQWSCTFHLNTCSTLCGLLNQVLPYMINSFKPWLQQRGQSRLTTTYTFSGTKWWFQSTPVCIVCVPVCQALCHPKPRH